MGRGRTRVCVAPGHGLVLCLHDPDRGRAPPRVERRLPGTDVQRRGHREVARRPEHHAVRIRLEPTTGPRRSRCTTDRGPALSVRAECDQYWLEGEGTEPEQIFIWSYVNG